METSITKQKKVKLSTLSDCPGWVRDHSDFELWKTGRKKLLEEIRGWYRKHGLHLRDENPLPELVEDDLLVAKLLTCLIWHWDKAGREAHAPVVENLEREIRGNGTKTDGRPLFDLVFAVAFCDEQEKAKRHYGEQLLPKLKKSAKVVHGAKNVPYTDDWISDFFIYLCEPGEKTKVKPMENNFHGHSGIVPWLKRALTNFLKTEFRKRYAKKRKHERPLSSIVNEEQAIALLDGLVDKQGNPIRPELLKEYGVHVIRSFKAAWESLDRKKLTRLQHYLGKMSDHAVAKLYGEVDSTAYRNRMRAIQDLKKQFWENLEESDLFFEIKEHLQQLEIELKNDLEQVLMQILESSGGNR